MFFASNIHNRICKTRLHNGQTDAMVQTYPLHERFQESFVGNTKRLYQKQYETKIHCENTCINSILIYQIYSCLFQCNKVRVHNNNDK